MPDRLTSKKENFISTREASKILEVSLRTVQLWVESGVLKAWKTAGGHRRISSTSVDVILNQRKEAINPSEGKDGKRLFHILLVEDDSALRNLFYYFFSSWKFPIRVDVASDGFEGLISLGREKPDLLVTDLNMPGMNGFEMIRHLKRSKDFDRLNIIVMTALNADYIKDVGGLPEEIQVFHKPVALSYLEPIIESLIASISIQHHGKIDTPA
ncbi:response regulator [Methylobacillus gramineus]|uniref:response regulator n=1 Tax=Methylobacillus gramineus TaxID=755169 RepID=UPI001CFF7F9E|nr:response regulator [Methylobacillus gramineus]MCB5184137.1 response regulator [Methylobacillus gramineus]